MSDNEQIEQPQKLKKVIPAPEWTPSYWKVSQLSSLSLRALGLHTYLMSLPEGWDISSDRISRERKEGRDAIRKSLTELEQAGLLKRTKHRQKDGTFRTQIEIFAVEQPWKSVPAPTSENAVKSQVKPETGYQASVNQASVNQASKKRDSRRETLEKDKEIPHTSVSLTSEIASRSTDIVVRRDDVEALCTLLADLIVENGKNKRPSISDKWRDAARLMLDRDGIPFQHVLGAIRWCQAHEFWRGVILSMPKLREKYDTLRLQAERDRPGNSPHVHANARNTPRESTTDQRVRAGLELAEKMALVDAQMAGGVA